MPGGAEIGQDGIGMAVIDLVPGQWVVAGYAMTTEPTTMTVTGRMPATLHEPPASATVTIGRRGLGLDRRVLRRGENVFRIDNADTTPHVVSIERVPRGTTPASVEATLRRRAGRRSAIPPLAPQDILHVTSTTDQSGGTSMWLPVFLPPGTYAVIGDVTAPTSTMSHDRPSAAVVVTVV
jgi:hypothetical protein